MQHRLYFKWLNYRIKFIHGKYEVILARKLDRKHVVQS